MKGIIRAIQVTDAIRIKPSKDALGETLLYSDQDELFYQLGENAYMYLFKYGVICFFNVREERVRQVTEELEALGHALIPDPYAEEIEIVTEVESNHFSLESIGLTTFDMDSLKLVMLNLSQSVALERYAEISDKVLEDTNLHTNLLEEKGKLDLSGVTLRKYIGKILNVKNRISENLYIFDSHDITWGDESLNKLDQDLKQTFDLKDRYRSIADQLGVIKENLDLFKDIMYQRESSKLEWIIILLILVEVIDLVLSKFL